MTKKRFKAVDWINDLCVESGCDEWEIWDRKAEDMAALLSQTYFTEAEAYRIRNRLAKRVNKDRQKNTEFY